jgi:hypothetical protein
MSHIVTIQSKVRDPATIAAACRRMGLAEPVHGTAKVYGTEATGLIVQLPGWDYPTVIDTQTGDVRYDNFNGSWGEQAHLDRFMQLYAVEKAKIEARGKGFQVTEQALGDGSIKLQIIEG